VIINAEFDLHLAERDNHFLSARLNVGLPGVDRNMAEQLIEDAEQLCPYSKATRGNIELSSTSFEPDPLCLLK
jgi:lipoyl-dependent peroxiredoxin